MCVWISHVTLTLTPETHNSKPTALKPGVEAERCNVCVDASCHLNSNTHTPNPKSEALTPGVEAERRSVCVDE